MKNDARLILNRKKQYAASRSLQNRSWKSPNFKAKTFLDARNVINGKRQTQKQNKPVLGTFMKTTTVNRNFMSQIKKEISQVTKPKMPGKTVQLSKDGNIIIRSMSKTAPRGPQRMAERALLDLPSTSQSFQPKSTLFQSSMDDLENTSLEDLLDLDSLPPAYVSNFFPSLNLSRNSRPEILEHRKTMVADQLVHPHKAPSSEVCVSNLHPSVSEEDILELFGDVGLIKSAEMLRPGTAIIDFHHASDAQRACEIYHNRLLDGLPMKCYLQTPMPKFQKTAISHRLGNRINEESTPVRKPLPVSIDPRSRYNPRDVKFTVKLI